MGKESEPIIIGYKYYMGMHLAICHESPGLELLEIIVGERTAWTGSVLANTTININQPELFGGEKKEGGIQGDLDVEFGGLTQGQNAYLVAHQGANTPAYRGVFCLVLKKMYLIAMNRYPKPWAIKVRNATAKNWYAAKSLINGGANGAHIIYDALTNADSGLGLSVGFINNTSFMSVADTLFTEGLGISLKQDKQMPVEKFIQSILTHIGGVLYVNKAFGTFVLKLIREPTAGELSTAVHFNESNVVELSSFARPSFAEMINEVVLKYRPQGALKDSAITVQDLASVQAQGGIVSQTVSFIGIDTEANASKIGLRELKQYSTPLATLKLNVNRDAWDINPGDIATFSWDDYNISNMVLRVLSIDYGTLTRGTISLDCSEDIYSLPTSSYLTVQPTSWVDPVTNPQTLIESGLYELSFFDITERFTAEQKAGVDHLSAYLMALPINNQSASLGHEMWTSPTSIEADYKKDTTGAYTPSAILDAALEKPKIGDLTETVVIASLVGFVENVKPGTYALINDEVIEVVSIDMVTLNMVIKRGLLDTVPLSHAPGDRIYFAENNRVISRTEYLVDPVASAGETVYVRYLTQTSIGKLELANSNTFVTSFLGRQIKPYPPKNVTINTLYHPLIVIQKTAEIAGKVFDSTINMDTIDITASTAITSMAQDISIQKTDDTITTQTEFDNALWTTVINIIGETGWTSNETRSFTIPSPSTSTHKAWRIKVTDNNGDTGTGTNSIDFMLSGTNQSTNTGTAYSNPVDGGTGITPAFDNTSSTRVFFATQPTTGSPVTLGKVFDTPIAIDGYRVGAENISANRSFKDWEIEYSDDSITNQTEFDNATWTSVIAQTNETGWVGSEVRTYSLNLPPVDYKALRLVVTDNNGGADVSIAEVKFMNGAVNESVNLGTTYESSFFSSTTKADKLFDDNNATIWQSAPVTFSDLDTIIAWHSVDRNLQTKPYVGWNEGTGNPPESSTVIHHLNIYDENDLLIRTETFPYSAGVSAYSYTYTQAQEILDSVGSVINTSLRIELYVTREDTFDLTGGGPAPYTIESWLRFDHRFSRLI